MAVKLKQETVVTLQISHLNMIQAAITRISGYSASVKTFTVTIVAAVAALAYQQRLDELLLIAAAFCLPLYALDAYYLGLERSFRTLYKNAATRDISLPYDLSMDVPSAPGVVFLRTIKALRAFPIASYYLMFLVALAGLYCWHPPSKTADDTVPVVPRAIPVAL